MYIEGPTFYGYYSMSLRNTMYIQYVSLLYYSPYWEHYGQGQYFNAVDAESHIFEF